MAESNFFGWCKMSRSFSKGGGVSGNTRNEDAASSGKRAWSQDLDSRLIPSLSLSQFFLLISTLLSLPGLWSLQRVAFPLHLICLVENSCPRCWMIWIQWQDLICRLNTSAGETRCEGLPWARCSQPSGGQTHRIRTWLPRTHLCGLQPTPRIKLRACQLLSYCFSVPNPFSELCSMRLGAGS